MSLDFHLSLVHHSDTDVAIMNDPLPSEPLMSRSSLSASAGGIAHGKIGGAQVSHKAGNGNSHPYFWRWSMILMMTVHAGQACGQSVDTSEVEILAAPASKAAQPQLADSIKASDKIVEQTNSFRQEQKLEQLKKSEQLTNAAKYFAEFMAATNKYGHTADGKNPVDRAREKDYEHCIVLENIAYLYSSEGFETEQLAKKFTEGWKQSPGHRKNMLDGDVTNIGVAIAMSEEGRYFAVQMLGRPRSQVISFQVVNMSDVEIEYEDGEQTNRLLPMNLVTYQRCRPAELVFKLGEGVAPVYVRPAPGEKLTIERDERGDLRIHHR
jgi:uncharacterized protein YkwD